MLVKFSNIQYCFFFTYSLLNFKMYNAHTFHPDHQHPQEDPVNPDRNHCTGPGLPH